MRVPVPRQFRQVAQPVRRERGRLPTFEDRRGDVRRETSEVQDPTDGALPQLLGPRDLVCQGGPPVEQVLHPSPRIGDEGDQLGVAAGLALSRPNHDRPGAAVPIHVEGRLEA